MYSFSTYISFDSSASMVEQCRRVQRYFLLILVYSVSIIFQSLLTSPDSCPRTHTHSLFSAYHQQFGQL